MKSEQSTCQDKIRLPRSTRFDPISASDLGFSSAGDNKTILAEGVGTEQLLHIWSSWGRAGMGSPGGHSLIVVLRRNGCRIPVTVLPGYVQGWDLLLDTFLSI